MKLIGLDIGTSACKAILFTEDGSLVATAMREYPIATPHPGWAEQDPTLVWASVKEVLREIAAKTGDIDEGPTAIGLSVQGEALIPVDRHGNALRPAILGMDTRTAIQNEKLRAIWGENYLFKHTGMPIHTINTLPKVLWLKENEPELLEHVDGLRLYEDFIIGKMTGIPIISQNLASRTQMYDLHKRGWSDEILDTVDIDRKFLSEIAPSGTNAGTMDEELSVALGFSQPPIIATGGHDQACGALGAGLTKPGLAMVSTGTAEVLEVVLPEPHLDDVMYNAHISCYEHVVPDKYLGMTLNHSGGLILRWFRDTFCQEETHLAQALHRDPYDLILQNASPEPSPVILLPHFSGSGSPWLDASSKGVLLGLTFATTKVDIAKAILEGITYELQTNINILKKAGISINELRAIGGGARSSLWLQLKAEITGIPVYVPKITDSACWGAALLAGKAVGLFPDVMRKSEETFSIAQAFKPDLERKAHFDERYSIYKDVYPTVREICHRL